MKIGIVCPVGHLNKYGYQYINYDCLRSQATLADRLYLVHSTRDRTGVSELLKKIPNIIYISEESTWFGLNQKGKEIYDIHKVVRNSNVGLEVGISDGMDCMIQMANNWYIAEPEVLVEHCYKMLCESRGWVWLYRKDQLVDTMFHASTRIPWIFNSSIPNLSRWGLDSLCLVGKVINWEHGDFRSHNKGAVVDVALEMLLSDLEAKLDYFGRNRNEGIDYSVGRFQREKHISSESLSPTGLSIAASSQPDFVSNEVLKRL